VGFGAGAFDCGILAPSVEAGGVGVEASVPVPFDCEGVGGEGGIAGRLKAGETVGVLVATGGIGGCVATCAVLGVRVVAAGESRVVNSGAAAFVATWAEVPNVGPGSGDQSRSGFGVTRFAGLSGGGGTS